VKSSRHVLALAEYGDRFGTYRGDDYRSPAQCPEDRRSLVAEIKVGEAAAILANHFSQYVEGDYLLPYTEDLHDHYKQVADWDPHLPRKGRKITTTG